MACLARRVSVVLVVWALVAPAAASASPGWLSPVGLSATGQEALNPQVAVDAQGNATAVWYNGTNFIVQGASRPAGGAWGAAADLSAPGQSAFGPQVAVDGQGNATAVWYRYDGTNNIVQGASRPAGGVWGAAVDLSVAGRDASAPQVAVDGQGNATAVWQRFDGTNNIVQGASRPAGGAWGPAVDLSVAGQSAGDPQVAVDGQGNATAVWSRFNGTNNIVQGASRPAGGAWGTPDDLSVAGQNAGDPQVAVDGQGNATAVWSRFNGTNNIVQGASRPAGGTWGTPDDLSVAGQNASVPQVAVDGQGNATAVWSRFDGANYRVQGASRPAGGTWGAAANLSAPGQNAFGPQVAVDGQGNATAVWSRFNGTNNIVQGASRPAGGTWGTPDDLSVAGQNAYLPQVAVDGEGNATAVWYRFDGTNNIVQGALFDAAGPRLGALAVPATGSVGQALGFSLSASDAVSGVARVRWEFGEGTAAEGASVTRGYSAPGSYRVTATAVDGHDNATSQTRTIAITANPARPAKARISAARLTRRRFHVARRPTAIRARKGPRGTTIRFSLSAPATIRIAITAKRPGRRAGRRCVKPTAKLIRRHARRCTRTITIATLRRANRRAGTNAIAFSGRIGRRALRPGRYTAKLTATNSAGTSRAVKLAFTILR